MQTEIKRLEGALSQCGERVLVYDVSYPAVTGAPACAHLSRLFEKQTHLTLKRDCGRMFKLAVKQKKEMGEAFSCLGVRSETQIMFLNKGVLSFFTDHYYDLGFGGKKCERRSQTRNCENGRLLTLKDLFERGTDHAGLIYAVACSKISLFEEETGQPLYKDWRTEIKKSVYENRYYLADDGIALYVPQGVVTSAVWGVPTFLISFKELGGSIKRRLL